MADNNGIKKPPSVGPMPGSSMPKPPPPGASEEEVRAYVKDRYFLPTDYTPPEWMTRLRPIGNSYNHFKTPEGDVQILFMPKPFITSKPFALLPTLFQIKGLDSPEGAVHFLYDFARDLYLFEREKEGLEHSESLSNHWLKFAQSYANARTNILPIPSPNMELPITFQSALDRIEYQMRYGCGLVTLDATLAHLWAYCKRRAEDAPTSVEKEWSTAMANHVQFALILMSHGNHNDLIQASINAVNECLEGGRKDENVELAKVAGLLSLASAEICYRHAACSTENAVRQGHIIKGEPYIRATALTLGSFSEPAGEYASNLYGLMKNVYNASGPTDIIKDCTPVGMNVPGYGPTAVSIQTLNEGLYMVHPLTPIVRV